MTTYNVHSNLGRVLRNADPGDTINVHAGIYNPVAITTNGIKLNLLPGAIIDGDRNPAARHGIRIDADWVSVTGGEVRDVHGAGIAATDGSHHITIRGVYSHHNDGHGISAVGGNYYNIIGNEVAYNWGLMSMGIRHTSGISVMGPRNIAGPDVPYEIRIVGNDVHHNGTDARTDGYGIINDFDKLRDYDGATLIADNAVWENGNSGAYVHKSSDVTLRDNFFWHNGQDETKVRAVEIGINLSHDVRLIRNIAEAEHDEFVFYSGGGSTQALNGNRFYADGHDDHIVAPWSAPVHMPASNWCGIDPAEAFPWWNAGHNDHPNWDL